MIRIIIIDDLKLFGIIEFVFIMLKYFWGPYVSCHILSLFWNIFMKGDEYRYVIVDK